MKLKKKNSNVSLLPFVFFRTSFSSFSACFSSFVCCQTSLSASSIERNSRSLRHFPETENSLLVCYFGAFHHFKKQKYLRNEKCQSYNSVVADTTCRWFDIENIVVIPFRIDLFISCPFHSQFVSSFRCVFIFYCFVLINFEFFFWLFCFIADWVTTNRLPFKQRNINNKKINKISMQIRWKCVANNRHAVAVVF